MELSATSSGRREERVPLDALIELRSDESDEVLEADGLDLGAGGLSMRASFVPPVGKRLECAFRCPPSGDPVRAHGEVVWAEAVGPRSGAFGMRFLELDTKSATAIRRVVEPDYVPAPAVVEPPRVATMRIDGLGAPIETDVRLSEPDRVVLEQELSFLRLGRGVEVEVPGRGKERGRIASVELRHGPLNVPTLVFGVLLDEVRAPEPVMVPVHVPVTVSSKQAYAPRAAAAELPEPSDESYSFESEVEAPSASEPSVIDTWPERPIFVDTPPAAAEVEVSARAEVKAPKLRERPSKREADASRVIVTESDPEPKLSDEEHAEVQSFSGTPAFLVSLRRVLVTLQIIFKARCLPWLESTRDALRKWSSESMPKVQRFTQQLGTFASLQVSRVKAASQARAAEKQRRTTAPAPRVQRAQAPAAGAAHLREAKRIPEDRPPPRNRRMLASALAVVGVGLGVYALAPRSEADRIPVRRRPVPVAETAVQPQMPVEAQPMVNAPVAMAAPQAPVAPAPQASVGAAVVDPTAPNPGSAQSVFGASEVPNGRVFAIRMSGPVESVEGDQREDGFTVRVPGRLALDRASPIATSHRAVARAMILNRGDYAELTVDFLPGLRPKYQVSAKDNSIEVTLERL